MLLKLTSIGLFGKTLRASITPLTVYLVSNKLSDIEIVCWFLILQAVQSRAIFEAGLSIVYKSEFFRNRSKNIALADPVIKYVENRVFKITFLFMPILMAVGYFYFSHHDMLHLAMIPLAMSIILSAWSQIIYFWIIKFEFQSRFEESQSFIVFNQLIYISSIIACLLMDLALFSIPVALCISNIFSICLIVVFNSRHSQEAILHPTLSKIDNSRVAVILTERWKKVGLVFSVGFLLGTLQFWTLPFFLESSLIASIFIALSLFRAIQSFWETVISSTFGFLSEKLSAGVDIGSDLIRQAGICILLALFFFLVLLSYQFAQSELDLVLPYLNLPSMSWITCIGVVFLVECLNSICSNTYRVFGVEPYALISVISGCLSFVLLTIGLYQGLDQLSFIVGCLPRIVYFGVLISNLPKILRSSVEYSKC